MFGKKEGKSPSENREEASKDEASAAGGMMEIKEDEYQRLLKDLADYKDRYLRLCAEFENFRKRNERERGEFIKHANEGLIIEFLSILDDLGRCVEAATAKHQDYEAFLKGVEMVMAHIHELLKKHDVRVMDSVGKKFDPHLHEILMQFPSQDHGDGEVVEEFQKGYQLGDKVIRTAKVKVAVHPQEDLPPMEKSEEI